MHARVEPENATNKSVICLQLAQNMQQLRPACLPPFIGASSSERCNWQLQWTRETQIAISGNPWFLLHSRLTETRPEHLSPALQWLLAAHLDKLYITPLMGFPTSTLLFTGPFTDTRNHQGNWTHHLCRGKGRYLIPLFHQNSILLMRAQSRQTNWLCHSRWIGKRRMDHQRSACQETICRCPGWSSLALLIMLLYCWHRYRLSVNWIEISAWEQARS